MKNIFGRLEKLKLRLSLEFHCEFILTNISSKDKIFIMKVHGFYFHRYFFLIAARNVQSDENEIKSISLAFLILDASFSFSSETFSCSSMPSHGISQIVCSTDMDFAMFGFGVIRGRQYCV